MIIQSFNIQQLSPSVEHLKWAKILFILLSTFVAILQDILEEILEAADSHEHIGSPQGTGEAPRYDSDLFPGRQRYESTARITLLI